MQDMHLALLAAQGLTEVEEKRAFDARAAKERAQQQFWARLHGKKALGLAQGVAHAVTRRQAPPFYGAPAGGPHAGRAHAAEL